MTTDVLIQVTDLQKHFKGGKQNQDEKIRALDGVSTEIHKGEVVVVIGPSGSGKSTFLRCLNLLELPTGGQILFDGVDITDKNCNINLHRQKMGMVFQHALRRAEAACRHRPRPCHAARGHALRRADERA